ncbi:leucine-rich repeat domain-containing protein [Neorhizobium galegae]|nr:leucine-rich repeat domain-containing protein [Neorhizobium galegae]
MVHWLDKVVELINANTHDLKDLARIAGYDPKVLYRGTSMRGLNFSDQDIAELELSDVDEPVDEEQYSPRLAKERVLNNMTLPKSWGEKLTHFRASRRRIDNIYQLINAPNLRELRIPGTLVRDIESVRGSRNLERISISDTAISDLSALSNCKLLVDVEISNTRVSNIGPLSAAPLYYLVAVGAPISDISSLNVRHLRYLDIDHTEVEFIDVLEKAENLHTLSISNTSVRNITALRSINKLRSFWGHGLRLEEWAPLLAHKSLQNLHISGTLVENSNILREFPELSQADLRGVGLKDITFLEDTKKIQYLDVSNNALKDLTGLRVCNKLTNLNISGNNIENYRELSSVASLVNLDLGDTDIEDLSVLAGLESLYVLSLRNCKYVNLSALISTGSVGYLDVRGVNIDKYFPTYIPESLHTFDVSYDGHEILEEALSGKWNYVFRGGHVSYSRQI